MYVIGFSSARHRFFRNWKAGEKLEPRTGPEGPGLGRLAAAVKRFVFWFCEMKSLGEENTKNVFTYVCT